ncbi:MAG: hypothetical protein WC375_03615 [Methanomassiliicoccales archaeon]|jgi:hypothetical protein
MSIQTRTTALQNEIARLYCAFEHNGTLTNPIGQPVVEIMDTDGVTVLSTAIAQLEHTGVYYADWYVPANLPEGDYYDRWTFQWDAVSSIQEITSIVQVHSFDSYINFLRQPLDHHLTNKAVQLLNDLANDFIYECQHIPIYWEQGMRVQQENRQHRVKSYYYFNVTDRSYYASAGAIYTNGTQRFTVFENLLPVMESSSSSSSSDYSDSSTSSSGNPTYSSSSSSNSSSSSVSSESSISSSSSSELPSESSSSSSLPVTTTTTTTQYEFQPTMVCVGLTNPATSGTLTKVSGTGSQTISYTNYAKKSSSFSTVYNLAYQNWNIEPRPIVRVNNRIMDNGWHADYMGNIYFDGLMAPEDSINVSYRFAYFSVEELLGFLRFGLNMMNATPPASTTYSSFDSMPPEWSAGVLLYAAILAYKRLIFGLSWQEKRIIYRDPITGESIADSVASQWQNLYQSYSETWTEFKKDVKTRKLPGIAAYVTPEYTLPGGRSRFFRYLYKSM